MEITKTLINNYLFSRNQEEFSTKVLPLVKDAFDSQTTQEDRTIGNYIKQAFAEMGTEYEKNLSQVIAKNNGQEMKYSELGNKYPTEIDVKDTYYEWFIDKLSNAQSIEDIASYKRLLSKLKEDEDTKYFLKFMDLNDINDLNEDQKKFYDDVMNSQTNTYKKIMFLLDKILSITEREITKKQRKEIVQKFKEYEPKYSEGINLKETDNQKKRRDQLYYFDQPQGNTNNCWACSGTYVMNSYIKVNKLDAKNFNVKTFKDSNNFKTNELAGEFLKNKEDYYEFYQNAQNISDFLNQGNPQKMGNPYVVGDVIIDNVPNTALHQIIFPAYVGQRLIDEDPELEHKLEQYYMDKIQQELERTKAPISMLRGMHYRSIVAVDREKGMIRTMNSTNSENHLNDYDDVSISSLVKATTNVQLFYPEYIGEKDGKSENLDYLANKFGFSKDIYDGKGDLKTDENILLSNGVAMLDADNMLHINGYHFKYEDKEGLDISKELFGETIYLPANRLKPKKAEYVLDERNMPAKDKEKLKRIVNKIGKGNNKK